MEEPTTIIQNENSIELLPEGVKHLDEARKWSMFISILGFITVGFLILAAVLIGVFFRFLPSEDLPGGIGIIISILYIVMAALYFFPVLYLNQFSQKAKQAITELNSKFLVEAIAKLKSHYKFIGIMTIILLATYPVIVIIAIVLGISSTL